MGRPRKNDKHLPPCVLHRHGAYYYVKNGKWEPLGRDLASALTRYAAKLETPKDGELGTLIDAVLAKVSPTLAQSTVDQYTYAAELLKDMLQEFKDPSQVLPKHAAKVKTELADTPNMANRVLSFARVVFNDALERQVIDSNPFIGIKRYKEKKRGRLITLAEYSAVYEKAGDRLQVIMDLLYLTGQRIDDVLKIKRAHLQDPGIYFKQKKTGKELIVAWTPELRATVERAKSLRGRISALTLMTGRTGKAPDYRSVREQWEKACEAAKVENAHLHDIRAMSGTAADNQGIDAQALLGHTDERTTRIYLRDRQIPIVQGPSFQKTG